VSLPSSSFFFSFFFFFFPVLIVPTSFRRHLELSKKLHEQHLKHQELAELHRSSFRLLQHHFSKAKVSHFFDTVKDLLVNYFVVFEGLSFFFFSFSLLSSSLYSNSHLAVVV